MWCDGVAFLYCNYGRWGVGGLMYNMSVDDDDSVLLNVEMPLEEKAKVAALLSSWDFTLHPPTDPLELRFYMVVNQVYLRNLIDKKEERRLSDYQRKRLGPDCLICHEFKYVWVSENGRTRDRDEYHGEIVINFKPFHGLQLVLRLGELELSA